MAQKEFYPKSPRESESYPCIRSFIKYYDEVADWTLIHLDTSGLLIDSSYPIHIKINDQSQPAIEFATHLEIKDRSISDIWIKNALGINLHGSIIITGFSPADIIVSESKPLLITTIFTPIPFDLNQSISSTIDYTISYGDKIRGLKLYKLNAAVRNGNIKTAEAIQGYINQLKISDVGTNMDFIRHYGSIYSTVSKAVLEIDFPDGLLLPPIFDYEVVRSSTVAGRYFWLSLTGKLIYA